ERARREVLPDQSFDQFASDQLLALVLIRVESLPAKYGHGCACGLALRLLCREIFVRNRDRRCRDACLCSHGGRTMVARLAVAVSRPHRPASSGCPNSEADTESFCRTAEL